VVILTTLTTQLHLVPYHMLHSADSNSHLVAAAASTSSKALDMVGLDTWTQSRASRECTRGQFCPNQDISAGFRTRR
jgi:hypothetical protein